MDLYFERSIGDLKVASDAILQLDGVGDLNHIFFFRSDVAYAWLTMILAEQMREKTNRKS